MGTGLDARWRVTARVVRHRAGNMTSQLGEVAGQLVDPVDSTQVDLTSFVVDHQMCETSFGWGEGEEGGGGGGRSGAGGHGEGEEQKEDGEDEKGWVEVGGHGSEGRGGVNAWVLVCIFDCVILCRVSQRLIGLQGTVIQKKSFQEIDFLFLFFPPFSAVVFITSSPDPQPCLLPALGKRNTAKS